MRKVNYKKKILSILSELAKSHPTYEMSRHIDTAFSEYKDMWGISDKEFLFALEKYQTQLELDENNIASEDFVYLIEKDAAHLFDNISDEEEEEY